MKNEGYFFDPTAEIADPDLILNPLDIPTEPPVTFIDPNGVRCSQECFDDCPEDYICSEDCYTASLTQSGCGCCQCIEDNDCPPGYICNEVNECIEA